MKKSTQKLPLVSIFAAQSLTISIERIKSFALVCEHSVFHEKLLIVSYFMEVISKTLTSEKSATFKQWFLQCRVLRNHVITGNSGIPNRLCSVPVEDLGCLTCLLQNMAKIVQEEIANESNLVKLLLHLGTGGHCDCWIKRFDGLGRCYDGQWPLTCRYFKCWSCNQLYHGEFRSGYYWFLIELQNFSWMTVKVKRWLAIKP